MIVEQRDGPVMCTTSDEGKREYCLRCSNTCRILMSAHIMRCAL